MSTPAFSTDVRTKVTKLQSFKVKPFQRYRPLAAQHARTTRIPLIRLKLRCFSRATSCSTDSSPEQVAAGLAAVVSAQVARKCAVSVYRKTERKPHWRRGASHNLETMDGTTLIKVSVKREKEGQSRDLSPVGRPICQYRICPSSRSTMWLPSRTLSDTAWSSGFGNAG